MGVNKYRLPTEEKVEVLSIDNKAVLTSQLDRLEKVRASRSGEQVQEAMDRLTQAAAVSGFLLPSLFQSRLILDLASFGLGLPRSVSLCILGCFPVTVGSPVGSGYRLRNSPTNLRLAC